MLNLLHLALLAMLLLPQDAPPASAPAEPESTAPGISPLPPAGPARVVIWVSRNREVGGYVELEDEEVLVVRRLDREIESFTKNRVLKIVRLTDPLPGQQGTVLLRNGQIVSGEILEDGFEKVVVRIEGIPVELKRADVDETVLRPTFEQRYARFRAMLQPNQVDDHLDLCRWLMEQRRYDLARRELLDLLDETPDSAEARRLLHVVDAQIALQGGTITAPKRAGTIISPGGASEPSPDAGPVYPSDLLPSILLTRADVNLVRVFEIDFERPPKVAVPPDAIRTLLEQYGADPALPSSAEWRKGLFRADPLQVVSLMFELRSRELYPKINVLTEPHSLNLFRQRVHNTWLMNNCATSRCHGGPGAGRLFLHNRNYRDARVRYTNLMILERLELDPRWPLVNFDSPNDSLIIQHGLPREVARRPHPEVKGWKPVFNRGNQRMHTATVEWIRSMMLPRPEYPVDYTPVIPGRRPAEEPETTAPIPLDDDTGRTPR